jgi:hypothetical protein
MEGRKKREIITFKVDEPLAKAMHGIQNRSEFIRSAILHALDSICPLCKGAGILTHDQYNHWNAFAKNHFVEECEKCHALHLVCNSEEKREIHDRGKDENTR